MNRGLLPIITVIIASLMLAYTNIITTHTIPEVFHINYNQFSAESQKEIRCLAENIYFESAYEPDEGKLAVAFVTINRTKHPSYPTTICDVVTQKTHKTCQFSWYCQDKQKKLFVNENSARDESIYRYILELASFVYVNHEKIKDPTDGALFYHADYVNPRWKNVVQTKVIGRHIFYTKKDT